MAIAFFELEPTSLKDRKRLKTFIYSLFLKEGRELNNMNIIFCSDGYLLEINRLHLEHDFYTDIITFDLSESKGNLITAELYISIDRVKENALILKTTFCIELHRVIFHGCLHLCGYTDKRKKDIGNMRAKEEESLILYFSSTNNSFSQKH